MTGVTISWKVQVVLDSERTPDNTAPRTPPHTPSNPRTPATHTPSNPHTPPHAHPRHMHPRHPRYCGTPGTTREVPRNSATTLSPQYKVTSVIPLRP